jgi:cytochrome c peroxidase
MGRFTVLPIALAIGSVAMLAPGSGQAQTLQPKLPDLSGIVKDEEWALVLGKALFWDVAVGSDGVACASCHFHAGADARISNALSPGLLQLPELDPDFGATEAMGPFGLGETASGGMVDSTYQLVEGDFPFHQLADISDRNSQLLVTTNDVASSAGAVGATLTRIRPVGPFDDCDAPSSDVFHAGGLAARQVEPRNTPTVINAVFNHRNFWDGRAMNDFNGVGVFGAAEVETNPAARLVLHDNGAVELTSLDLPESSLASQAVGPPLSNLEMSCGERNFPSVGRKLLGSARKPLSLQLIHANDSVFGANGWFGDLRASNGRGLRSDHTYRKLVERAFEDRWWAAPKRYRITEDGQLVQGGPGSFTQAELNFSMFWGIAVMLYESTLISDDSPFDRAELSEAAQRGRTLFTTGAGAGGGGCSGCHALPLGTQAAQFADSPPFVTVQIVNRPNGLLDGSGNPITTNALRDRGFFPLGVRPVAEDVVSAAPTRMASRCRSRASRSSTAAIPMGSPEQSLTGRSKCRACGMSPSRHPISTTAASPTCTRCLSSTGGRATAAMPA